MLQDHRRVPRRADILFGCGGLLVLAFFIWKLPLEIQGLDEPFYITIPKRLLAGDVFVVDEWFGGQFYAFLMLPLAWLNELLFGYEGAVLHYRVFYLICQTLCAVVIYIRLREYGVFGALAALFFYIFTPFDIVALSYDTLGLMLGALTAVFLATAKSKKAYFAAGLFYGGAVLCCPHLIAGYAVYSAAVLLAAALRKRAAMVKDWLAFTMGGGLLAALLVAFILSRTSLSRFLQSIPLLFTDPGHQQKSLVWGLVEYIFSILDMWPGSRYVILLCGVAVLVLAADKNRSRHASIYMTFAALASIVLLLGFIPKLVEENYNSIMIPLLAAGVMAYFAAEEKDHRVFLFVMLGAIVYSVCIHFASNQGIYVISMIMTIANIGSILLLKNVWPQKGAGASARVCRAAICLLFVVQFGMMTYTKANHMFWSTSDVSELTQTIQEGPYKGLRVTEETEKQYLSELERLEPMKGMTGSVMYAGGRPWYYLATPSLQIGAYCPWTEPGNQNVAVRTLLYCGGDVDRLPDYVFIPEENEGSSGPLKEWILDRYGYEREDLDGAVLYCKPEA